MTVDAGLRLTQAQMRALNVLRESGRPSEDLSLIAVSKTQSADAIELLYRQGQYDFGENYVQELCAKAAELGRRGCRKIRWHFIGHLQSNKVKILIPLVTSIHSVDSEKLAREIAKHCEKLKRQISIFIEVNIDREASKGGLFPEQVSDLAQTITTLPSLKLEGLMCIPKATSLFEEKRTSFARLLALEQTLGPLSHRKLSMGMSDDFEAAVAEGATHLRLGSVIFGARLPKAESAL